MICVLEEKFDTEKLNVCSRTNFVKTHETHGRTDRWKDKLSFNCAFYSKNVRPPACLVFQELKRPLGRPRRRWENNIKINQKEIDWETTGLMWLRIGISGGLL